MKDMLGLSKDQSRTLEQCKNLYAMEWNEEVNDQCKNDEKKECGNEMVTKEGHKES